MSDLSVRTVLTAIAHDPHGCNGPHVLLEEALQALAASATDEGLRAALERARLELMQDVDPDAVIVGIQNALAASESRESLLHRIELLTADLKAERAASATDDRTYTQAEHDEAERQLRDCHERLAASATDEGPDALEQWQDDCLCWHVCPARPAVPALDVERLGDVIADLVSRHGWPTGGGPVFREWMREVAREYAALSERPDKETPHNG